MIFLLLASHGFPADRVEHHDIPRAALHSVLTDCRENLPELLELLFSRNGSLDPDIPLWRHHSFADICSLYTGDDLSFARSQEYRRTILQQLQSLQPELLLSCWNQATFFTQIKSLEQKDKNAAVNYLLHHVIALRLADRASTQAEESGEELRYAFIYEAMAESYLVDMFSSAHILVEHRRYPCLQPFNYRKAHDFFRTEGAFVINSCGDVWQTFGDGLMLWYEPSYRFALDACKTSLKELLLIFYSSAGLKELPAELNAFLNSLHDPAAIYDWLKIKAGADYYQVDRMPSLLSLPVPVTASWSKESGEVDEHGIDQRIRFPQLQESGMHDPDMEGIDPIFLFSKTAVPEWLIFEEFRHSPHPDSARKLIKTNQAYASVRYTQQRYFPPSYVGLLAHFAGGISFKNPVKPAYAVGVGFGLSDDLIFLNHLSADMIVDFIEGDSYLSTMIGVGIRSGLPGILRVVNALRLETGYPFEKGRKFKTSDHKLAIGIEFPAIPLRFTYAAITPRLMFQTIHSSSIRNWLVLQFIFH